MSIIGLLTTRSRKLVKPQIAALLSSDSGAVLVEYAVVMSLLSFVLVGGMLTIESATSTAYRFVTNELVFYAQRNGS